MHLKKLLTLSMILLFTGAFAQRTQRNLPTFDSQRWHWGYYLGTSFYHFKFDVNSAAIDPANNQLLIETQSTPGFSVGLLGDLRLSSSFNLRFEPGISYTERIIDLNYVTSVNANLLERTIRSTYIDLPVFVKFAGQRRDNFKPYIISGAKVSFDLASEENNAGDNLSQIFRMTTFNLFWDAGIGVDWYLPYFKFSTEIRGSFGILNELVRDGNPPGSGPSDFTDPINSLHSRAVFIILKFE